MNTAIWLVRREFWENRAIWVIPTALGGFLVLAALFGRIDAMSIPLLLPNRTVTEVFLVTVAATFVAVMSIYSTWYLLDCLFADRRDRSVLFWKSLPITDTATVVCKLATALIVIPAVYFVAADLSTAAMAFIISIRAGTGAALWQPVAWLQLQVLWIYSILTAALWYLPVAGYLMVVSAWAKRAVMLWSILPPIALVLAERWFRGTHHVAQQLAERLLGWVPAAFHVNPGGPAWVTTVVGQDTIQTPASIWSLMNVGEFLADPATWAGIVIGAALIAGAIQLRMRRVEI
jgi:ABC-2 type transport system permease protein